MKRKWITQLLLVAAAAVSSGCATPFHGDPLFGASEDALPSVEVMKAETANYQLPKLPEANKAVVYIVRPSRLGILVRRNVFVDDQEPQSEMGYMRPRQYIYFNLTPGEHKIFSKEWSWAEATVSAKAGDIIFFQHAGSRRGNLFRLEDYRGKYLVKTLSVGTIIKTDR